MKSRTESLQVAKHRLFDLLVIGGGIAGAGVAQNAASRGMSVLLVEKDDFASGTSSRTTKLIHGGLRYLEQFRLKLTAELCGERARLEKLAPHLVRDFSFILPLSKRHQMFNWKMHLGLTLYDLVALSAQTHHKFESLRPQAVLDTVPALSRRDLAGGLRFHDCITDDSRIVLEVIKSACQENALALNYIQAKGFVAKGNTLEGVVCRDRYTGEEFTVRAKAVVNATGVWADDVVKLADPAWTKKITPSKGTHIIVPQSAFETNCALFLPTDDNRYVFVVPWQNALMIGTTDKGYDGDIDNPLPARDEVDYLLEVVNSYTDTHKLSRSDITGCFAGLRPLVRFSTTDSGDDTSSMSRDHLIFESNLGLINVAGGKLTSYRLMAEEVMHTVLQRTADLPAGTKSKTDTMMLGGWTHKNEYLAEVADMSARARKLGIDPGVIDHLIASYGADAGSIIDVVGEHPNLGERICPDFAPIMAEVVFAVQHEMAVCLEDIFFRRTRLAIINARQTLEAAPKVAALMQRLCEWDKSRVNAELSAIDSLLGEHLQPISDMVAAT
jgi:glycerol-3-phosphate dehydrogenase